MHRSSRQLLIRNGQVPCSRYSTTLACPACSGRWGIYPTSKEWTDVVDPFTLDPVDRLNSGERTVSCPAGKSKLLAPRRRESWVCENG
jgi:hypothetical protein